MKSRSQYRLVTTFSSLVGINNEYLWRVTDTKPLSKNKDNIRIKGLGYWVHDKTTDECTRLVSTKYRQIDLENKMNELDVPLKRVDEIKFNA